MRNGLRMKKSKEIQDFIRLQGYLKPYVVQFVFFIMVAGISQFLTFLFVGNLLKKIVLCVQHTENGIDFHASLGYLVAIFLFTCMMAFGVYHIKKIEEKIRVKLRKQMIHKYVSSDEFQVAKISSEEMMNRLSVDLTKSVELVGWIIAGTIYMPVLSGAFSLIYVFKINYFVAFMSFGIVILEYFLLKLFSEKRKVLHENLVLLQKDMNNTLFEEKKGVIDARTFHLEAHFHKMIVQLIKQMNHVNKEYILLNGVRISCSQLYMECISSVILLVLGAFLSAFGIIEFADIMVTIALLDQITQMVFAIANFKVMVNEYDVYENRVFEILDLQKQESYLKKVDDWNVCLTLKNISFAYDKTKILSDISLNICRGEKVAIVGESGSGKSTLLKLLLGLYRPTSGEIQKQKNIKMAYVPQNITLLTKSVKENIVLDKRVDCQKVRQVAESVGADSFILEKDKEYLYQIGEEGDGFSGGQKARILLARALYQNVDVIFLDEVTSALDADTTEEVMKTLFSLQETVVMVTHRLVDMDKFDKIIVLENGKISGFGVHSELLKSNPCYERMYQKAMRCV